MRVVLALVAGLVFGFGLIISGMANPAKVQNFLDVFGQWDPSLAFVMMGAIAVAMPAFLFVPRLAKPWFADRFRLPTRTDLDSRLLAGSAIFGVGWGMAGYCPGPAVTALSLANSGTLLFVICMLIGMLAARFVSARLTGATSMPVGAA